MSGGYCLKHKTFFFKPNLVWWFWITEHFVTKFGMVMRHHEPESGGNVFVVVVIFKVKVTAKFQNVNQCLFRWYFLNRWTFDYQTWYGNEIIMSQIIFQKYWFAVFQVKVTDKNNIIKIWLFLYITLAADPFAIILGLMAHHHKVDFPVKRLDCSVVVMVKVTEKVQNSSECLSEWYLLSCWTFCNYTWYSDATL